MYSEFDLIQQYFIWDNQPGSETMLLGVGDDAAILQPPAGKQLIVTTDTFISGVHFPEQTPPDAIGYKALAVNLSDLAAMGADPAWFTLALTLPRVDSGWLHTFASSMKQLASDSGIALVGGDTTKGPLSITVQAMGFASSVQIPRRDAAKTGDKIYVTGTLGDAAAGLRIIQGTLNLNNKKHADYCQKKLNFPQPQLTASRIIRDYASSCIDISDGLLADLSHILTASGIGAIINTTDIPLSAALKSVNKSLALKLAMSGGDDYQLLFTIPDEKDKIFQSVMRDNDLMCYCIGHTNSLDGCIRSHSGELLSPQGFNHFQGLE
jgi:thiamine-monophosphate kinase